MLNVSICIVGKLTAIRFFLRLDILPVEICAKEFLLVAKTNKDAKQICNKREIRYDFLKSILNICVNLQFFQFKFSYMYFKIIHVQFTLKTHSHTASRSWGWWWRIHHTWPHFIRPRKFIKPVNKR